MKISPNIKHAAAVFFVIGISMVTGCAVKDTNTTDETFVRQNPPSTQNNYIGGEIVVGFKKEVSRKDAETVLVKYGFPFEWNAVPQVGKGFIYETGEKFVVKVPKGEEVKWMDTIKNEPTVAAVSQSFDSSKIDL